MDESFDNVIASHSGTVSAAVTLAAFGLSAASIAASSAAIVTCHNNDLLVSFDGINPAANTGHLLVAPGTYSVIGAGLLRAMKMNKSGSNANVTVSLIGSNG